MMQIVGSKVWAGEDGPESDVVFTTRVRLARNLRGFAFVNRANAVQSSEIIRIVQGALAHSANDPRMQWFDMATLSPRERMLLVERSLVSHQFAHADGPRSAGVSTDEALALLVNEEDHLRIQALRPGLQVKEAFAAATALDEVLAERLEFAFHPRWGFLTACPTNVGTGLRVSAMLHLPALALERQLPRLQAGVKELNLIIRGFQGEGSTPEGGLFQISNQVTLGLSAAEITDTFANTILPEILAWERAARHHYLSTQRAQAVDRAAREIGVLQSATLMGRDEALKRLGRIRHAIGLGLIEGMALGEVNRLVVAVQSAHLAWARPAAATDQESERSERASLLRDALAKATVTQSSSRS
ncbi:MAG: ATP--guanido phosphotransferase [Planctomycetota bacterium]|nr:ATP--guanido phosphotransferase [Planctomycetota bacterium]